MPRLVLLALALTACNGSTDDTDLDTDSTAELVGCFGDAPSATRTHIAVASLPFNADGGQDNRFTTFALAADGSLSPTGVEFSMGRAFSGNIRFSRDGRLGIAVQEDGSLGVFTVADDGSIAVVDPRYDGGDAFYASDVVFDSANERVWVVDGNWRNNGGGLYALQLDCESGALSSPAQVWPSKAASALILRDDLPAIVVADDVAESGDGADTHLLDLADGTVHSSAALLDDDAIIASAALVGDDWLLIGDNSTFSGVPNRVATARLNGNTIEPAEVISGIEDPYAIAASPWGNAALVSSGFGDELVLLRLADGAWSRSATTVRAPLPGAMQAIASGSLAGHVYVAENTGIRHLLFAEDGSVTDLGATGAGNEVDDVIGTMGVQP